VLVHSIAVTTLYIYTPKGILRVSKMKNIYNKDSLNLQFYVVSK